MALLILLLVVVVPLVWGYLEARSGVEHEPVMPTCPTECCDGRLLVM
jgi:hypothetical protein